MILLEDPEPLQLQKPAAQLLAFATASLLTVWVLFAQSVLERNSDFHDEIIISHSRVTLPIEIVLVEIILEDKETNLYEIHGTAVVMKS